MPTLQVFFWGFTFWLGASLLPYALALAIQIISIN
jgi:hypothetical protein